MNQARFARQAHLTHSPRASIYHYGYKCHNKYISDYSVTIHHARLPRACMLYINPAYFQATNRQFNANIIESRAFIPQYHNVVLWVTSIWQRVSVVTQCLYFCPFAFAIHIHITHTSSHVLAAPRSDQGPLRKGHWPMLVCASRIRVPGKYLAVPLCHVAYSFIGIAIWLKTIHLIAPSPRQSLASFVELGGFSTEVVNEVGDVSDGDRRGSLWRQPPPRG